MSDPADMPPSQQIDVNGISMKVYVAGPEDGYPIVLIHGWPELAYSWRHQIPALADAGFRVIAPNMRGYDGSLGPADIAAYDIFHLTGDLIGLLDHFGYDKALFAGHDWGGIVMWQLPLLHKARVAGLIALNTPFIPRLSADPIKLFRKAFGDEMYIVQMQDYGRVDNLLAAKTEDLFKYFMRRSTVTQEQFAQRPKTEGNMNLFWALQTNDRAAIDGGDMFLTPAEMSVYVEAFKRSGFTGGINWYRNFTRNWELTKDVPQHVDCEALMIMAARDIALPPAAAAGMEKYVPRTTKYLVEDSGHWTQQEQPAEVTRVMLDWLKERTWT